MKNLCVLLALVAFAGLLFSACEDDSNPLGITSNEVEENKALARRAFEEVWSQGKLDVIDEIYATNFIYHAPTGDIQGLEGFKQLVTMYRTGFPDLQFTVEDQFAVGDKEVTRWTATGTHNGDLMGIPPTGVYSDSWGIDIIHYVGGKAVEEWSSYDMLGMMQDLGVIPPLGQ